MELKGDGYGRHTRMRSDDRFTEPKNLTLEIKEDDEQG